MLLRSLILVSLTLLAGPTDTPTESPGPVLPLGGGSKTESQAVEPFPTLGIIPKREIGALELLKNHSEADGRGVVVAIFDSGVDPGVPALQTTTTGEPKIIALIDGTGSGDVPCTIVRKPDDETGTLVGLSGRKLKLGDWTVKNDEYRLGLKPGWELFDSAVIARLKTERREAIERDHQEYEQQLLAEIENAEAVKTKTKDQKAHLADLKTRLEQLRELADSHDDPGPVYDCLTFHDGERWHAVVDTDADGDLAEEEVLTDYHVNQQYATFGPRIEVNFGINIYDDGELLSIVTDNGMHGTHVAGIVAAHDPEDPERNGVAPGAQIVSVKIGDHRIDGMETSLGLLRGIDAVRRFDCDLINMSYGEPSINANRGSLVEELTRLVERENVLFVSSAGNAGPALSTVGAPGGTSEAILGIGAYISPEMMSDFYSVEGAEQGTMYTWSSRGPTDDGAMGVDLIAPGGAISPVPTSTLRSSLRANGTSMASPNACGGIALILSHLKNNDLPIQTGQVRRVLAETAETLPQLGRHSQGFGLIRVDRAAERLAKVASDELEPVRCDVSVRGRSGARGIYLRDAGDRQFPQRHSISVQPVFPPDTDPEQLVGWERKIALRTDVDWIDVGDHLFLNNGTSAFDVTLRDPSSNETKDEVGNGPSAGMIWGIDVDNPEVGPIFTLPVTVIDPRTMTTDDAFTEDFKISGGTVSRDYFDVPDGATFTRVKLSRDETGPTTPILISVHLHQLVPGEEFRQTQLQQYIRLERGETHTFNLPVESERTLELAVAPYWTERETIGLRTEVLFPRFAVTERTLALDETSPYDRFAVATGDHGSLTASGKLTRIHSVLEPASATITPLSLERTELTDERGTSELRLIYNYDHPASGSVVFRFPRNEGTLYGSPVGSHLYHVFDANGHRVGTDDVYPEAMRLDKGRYRIELELWNADRSVLEDLKTETLIADRPLGSSVAVPLALTRSSLGGSGAATAPSDPQRPATFWVARPASGKLPKGFGAGDRLTGEIHFEFDDGSGTTVDLPVSLRVVVPGGAHAEKTSESSPTAKKLNSRDDFETARRKSWFELLERADDDELFDEIFTAVREAYPDAVEPWAIKLKRLDREKVRKENLEAIIETANEVLDRIDADELAAYLGRRRSPETTEEKATEKRMTERKELLIDTLYRKGRAIGYRELPGVIAETPIEDSERQDREFAETYDRLERWVDPEDKQVYLLAVRNARRDDRFGEALKLIEDHAGNGSEFWPAKKRADLYRELGWDTYTEREQTRLRIEFPERMRERFPKIEAEVRREE